MPKVSGFRALLNEYNARWNDVTTKGAPVFITYHLPTTNQIPDEDEVPRHYGATGYYGLSASQKDGFREALSVVEAVTGVRYVEVDRPEDAMLHAARAEGATDAVGWSHYPTTDAYLLLNTTKDMNPGSRNFSLLLHELGHSLGLKHPFEGDIQLTDNMDSGRFTIMSYDRTGAEVNFGPLDIAALKHYYGGVNNVGPRWTYEFNTSSDVFKLTGAGRGDTLIGTDSDTVIKGRGGNDKIFGRDHDDKALGGAGNDKLDLGAGHNLGRGAGGNDKYIATGDSDRFIGGAGKDKFVLKDNYFVETDVRDVTFFGGAGVDTLILRDAYVWNFEIDLATGEASLSDFTFLLRSVENIIGTTSDDTITGDENDNRLKGLAGWDTLDGKGGNDRLIGGADDDEIIGGTGDDTMKGGAGWDTFVFAPNEGNDVILDFDVDEDNFDMNAFVLGPPELAAHFYEVGGENDDVVGWSYEGTTITIHGMDIADVTYYFFF